MDNIDEKLIKYRESIPRNEVTDAFKVFYETRDEKIRENLIYRYMPAAKRIILSLGINSIEEEDLVQMAYEELIRCIDIYNPYGKTLFYHYFMNSLRGKYKYRYIEEEEALQLSTLEIYSNENIENHVIDSEFKKYLILLIDNLLTNYYYQKHAEIFRMLYGLNGNSITKREDVAEKYEISQEMVRQIKNKMLVYLYKKLKRLAPFEPSEEIKNIMYLWFEHYDEDLVFYEGCDGLEDSHEVLERKRN